MDAIQYNLARTGLSVSNNALVCSYEHIVMHITSAVVKHCVCVK